jgi:hypothetical protein
MIFILIHFLSQGESEEKEENGKEYEPSRMLLLFLADL